MTKPLELFEEFINDEKAAEMFISGQAGTGKTTSLHDLVRWCMDNSMDYVVCAYTHKACAILASKLPEGANIQTLHKFLKKRPTVNEHAKEVKHIQNSQQQGIPEEFTLMLCDEYSMLGDKDYGDIGDRQYLAGTDIPNMKAVYIGDPNQLPPIDGPAAVCPWGKYQVQLTKIWRQDGDNKLLDTLSNLVTFIEGAPATPLEENDNFKRNTILPVEFAKCKRDKVLLAFTNAKVQDLNSLIEGKAFPTVSDQVFSPTTKTQYTFAKGYKAKNIDYIDMPFGDEPLTFGTKYRTLEHLISMDICEFAALEDELGGDHQVAYMFGHYAYKSALEALGQDAVDTNNEIERRHSMPAKAWSAVHKSSSLARKRAKAWRDYFTFKNCVICLDFTHAMTVHKSQGSTYDTVFLDTQDLGICAKRNYNLYLRLMYVGISRASNMVYTN